MNYGQKIVHAHAWVDPLSLGCEFSTLPAKPYAVLLVNAL